MTDTGASLNTFELYIFLLQIDSFLLKFMTIERYVDKGTKTEVGKAKLTIRYLYHENIS